MSLTTQEANTPVRATSHYESGYWEIEMFEVGDAISFSEVTIPSEPYEGMLVDCSDKVMEMVFEVVKIRETFECNLVKAEIEWCVE